MELIHDSDESGRLQDLKSYHILDTLPEPSFDQLTLLAARVCQTPIALLSFIDENRQWFKSTYGLNIHEIPRHLSACNKTIYEDGVYVIPDSEEKDCPYGNYMKGLGLRFYAGVPIVSHSGYGMGSLCVIDTVPRDLTEDQLETLKAIGQQIVENMEIRKRYQENLERLREFDAMKMSKDKKMLDIAYKRSHKAIAELGTGLNYRIRPHLLNIETNAKLLEKSLSEKEDLNRVQSVFFSVKGIKELLDKLDRFVVAEKEKWMKVVEISSVINEVLETLKYKFVENKIHVEFLPDQEFRCLGNYSKLVETFFALIMNAIEAIDGMKGGDIKISVSESHSKANILISDNGMGIEESIRPFIFQPFFSTKNATGGGVGLALAKAHAEEHGGDIALLSGHAPTSFLVTLPVLK